MLIVLQSFGQEEYVKIRLNGKSGYFVTDNEMKLTAIELAKCDSIYNKFIASLSKIEQFKKSTEICMSVNDTLTNKLAEQRKITQKKDKLFNKVYKENEKQKETIKILGYVVGTETLLIILISIL